MSLLGFISKSRCQAAPTSQDSFVGGSLAPFTGVLPPSDESLLCRNCRHRMCFLAQIYCPLSNSSYHRTLYFFVCLRNECQKAGGGWLVLRSQAQFPAAPPARSCSPTEWALDDDDDDAGDELPDVLSSPQLKKPEDLNLSDIAGPFSCSFIDVFEEQHTSSSPAIDLHENPGDLRDSPVPDHSTLTAWIQLDKIEQAFVDEDDNAPKAGFSGGLQNHLNSRGEYGCEDFRYCWAGRPIFDGPPPPELAQHLVCPRCHSRRVFEIQIFATVNNSLIFDPVIGTNKMRPYDLPDEPELNKQWPLNITTVLVFSCSAACWDDSCSWVEECVVIQTDENRTFIRDGSSITVCS
ncbi:unnamed protein product [Calicophoron daubneyi]|uniref:Programmed cell death protein 2 C-terminal domain-containing protein n=1 Tax=Calicophoron daubneyi TaxID=300641 RepID=A0AAV2TUU3_CALDB